MTRQTILGILFLLIGAGLLASECYSVYMKQPVSLALLLTGVGVLGFGAWMIPSSGAPAVFNQITVALGNSSLPVVGGRRVSDPPKDIEIPPKADV